MFKPLCFVENFLNSCRSLRCAETAKQNNPEIAEQLLCIIFQVHLVRDESWMRLQSSQQYCN